MAWWQLVLHLPLSRLSRLSRYPMQTVENGRKDLDQYRWRARIPRRVSPFFPIPLSLSERREMRLRLKDQSTVCWCVIHRLFYLVLVLLRVVAISRAKFWKRNGMCPSYSPGHYTFQITLGFLKKSQRNTNGENGNAREESWSDSVEGRLIDAWARFSFKNRSNGRQSDWNPSSKFQ
jgi:hypothetical protein